MYEIPDLFIRIRPKYLIQYYALFIVFAEIGYGCLCRTVGYYSYY